MSGTDPYQAPAAIEEAPGEQPVTLDALARRTFLAWEKLRILYVLILVVITLAMVAFRGFGLVATVEFWLTAVVGAIFANIAFFAGPVVETYVRWLGYRGEVLRLLLFTVGTVFACLLATGTVALMKW